MWLFSLMYMPLGLMHGPAAGILASIYVSHFGISLATVGFVTLVVRLFDAVTDPMVGYFSDKSETPWGKRKPFVVGGMVIVCLAIYFVYFPGANPSAAYFLGWFALLYLGWTIMEIPSLAWATELTSSTPGRIRIFMCRSMMTSGGALLMFAIPFLPIFLSTEITPETLRWVGSIGLVLLPLFTLVAVIFVGRGRNLAVHKQSELLEFLKSAFRNGPFLIYLTAALMWGIGTGMYFALFFLFFTQILGYIESFAIIGLISLAIAVPAYYFWVKISDRIGPRRMCVIANFGIAIFLLPVAFIPPGMEYFPITLVLICLAQSSSSGWFVGGQVLLADAADFDLLRTGVNRAGKYFSFQTFINKASNGLAGGIAFTVVGLVGYDAVIGAENTDQAIASFRAILVGPPVLLTFLSGLVILWFPITRHRHAIMRKRIESRAARVVV
jgi:GPH family glycoside/pentoside/hexuronide:cation symporter